MFASNTRKNKELGGKGWSKSQNKIVFQKRKGQLFSYFKSCPSFCSREKKYLGLEVERG